MFAWGPSHDSEPDRPMDQEYTPPAAESAGHPDDEGPPVDPSFDPGHESKPNFSVVAPPSSLSEPPAKPQPSSAASANIHIRPFSHHHHHPLHLLPPRDLSSAILTAVFAVVPDLTPKPRSERAGGRLAAEVNDHLCTSRGGRTETCVPGCAKLRLSSADS